MSAPSKSQVKKAGRAYRYFFEGRSGVDVTDASKALKVMQAFRAAHSRPLVSANMGLRSMLTTAGKRHGEDYGLEVTQRLKRLPTIIDKLRREPTMSLASMQDIGGCRAVLPHLEAVHVMATWRSLRKRQVDLHDYIATPKPSGYRGIHVIVEYPDEVGEDRKIEIQLRTPMQHAWAVTVERVGSRIGHDLKSGAGPQPVLELLSTIAEAMALEDAGDAVPSDLEAEIERLRLVAGDHLGAP